jgi:molybdate transport system substrate-binding protein
MIRSHVAVAGAVTVGVVFSSIVVSERAVAEITEIKVLSAVVMKSALDELARDFERATGHKVTLAYAPVGAIRDRIQDGEAFDLSILPRPIIGRLQAQGKIASEGTAVLARSEVSICVRAGAPKPDISNVDSLKRTLLAANSVAYSDPAKGGASGIHFARVLDQLGIAEQMKPRTKLTGPDSAEVVARGEAELCVNQAMEIKRTVGVDLVGPLPAELQNTTDFAFTGGIGSNAMQPGAAKAFISFLLAPPAARVIEAKGMKPGGQ